ncbi:uncharacterized protein EAF02_009041 [Botrytis sinoallii]|uniref:uncharacterized protein n=1 Tax=Botrytis sinoallii TaxID=1463999 RepID=UPI0019012116|nr:uncharacterized protein EAF02_009041 [Botrytis sinoallii]KAF7871936.1 hypothetical protein EAF02_009041 [Botrytis sinoallii]
MSVPLDFGEERFDPELMEADEIMERHEQLSMEVNNSVQILADDGQITKKKIRDFKKMRKLRKVQAFGDDAEKEIQTSLPKHKVLRINTNLPIGLFYQALEVILLYKGDLDEVREKGEEFRKLLLAKEDNISKTMYQALKDENQKLKEDYESLKAKRDSENDATEALTRKMSVDEIAKLERHLQEYIAKDKSAQDTIKTLEEKAGEANKSYIEISQSMEKLEKEVADRSSAKDTVKQLQNELEMSQLRHELCMLQLEKAKKGSTELHERLNRAKQNSEEKSERLSDKSLEISELRKTQKLLRAEAKANEERRVLEKEMLMISQVETLDALDDVKSKEKKIAEDQQVIKTLLDDKIRDKMIIEKYRTAHQINLGNFKQHVYDIEKELKEEQATCAKNLEQERATHEKQLKQERATHQEQVKQQQADHEDMMEREQATHRVRLEQKQAKHEKRTEQEKTVHRQQLDRDRATHQQQMKEQQTIHGKTLEQQQTSHKKKMEQEKSTHQNQLREERFVHEKEMKKLEQERIANREKLKQQQTSHERALTQIQNEKQDYMKEHNTIAALMTWEILVFKALYRKRVEDCRVGRGKIYRLEHQLQLISQEKKESEIRGRRYLWKAIFNAASSESWKTRSVTILNDLRVSSQEYRDLRVNSSNALKKVEDEWRHKENSTDHLWTLDYIELQDLKKSAFEFIGNYLASSVQSNPRHYDVWKELAKSILDHTTSINNAIIPRMLLAEVNAPWWRFQVKSSHLLPSAARDYTNHSVQTRSLRLFAILIEQEYNISECLELIMSIMEDLASTTDHFVGYMIAKCIQEYLKDTDRHISNQGPILNLAFDQLCRQVGRRFPEIWSCYETRESSASRHTVNLRLRNEFRSHLKDSHEIIMKLDQVLHSSENLQDILERTCPEDFISIGNFYINSQETWDWIILVCQEKRTVYLVEENCVCKDKALEFGDLSYSIKINESDTLVFSCVTYEQRTWCHDRLSKAKLDEVLLEILRELGVDDIMNID